MVKPDKIEIERQRLAQRLDQDILASLRLLQTQVETYRSALQHQRDASMALTVISSLLQQVIQRTQHLQNNLHPTILETLGLEPALEMFAADVQRIQGWQIALQTPRLPQRLSYDVELALFRTVQSLVDYAAQQVGAAHFDVRLQMQGERVRLQYQDDGRWLPSHMSIVQSLHEAIEALGGHFAGHLTDDHTLAVDMWVNVALETALTPREREVLQHVAAGYTNKQIATHLHLSARTVNFHLDNAYSKLGVNTRTEAVMVALQKGWIENPVK